MLYEWIFIIHKGYWIMNIEKEICIYIYDELLSRQWMIWRKKNYWIFKVKVLWRPHYRKHHVLLSQVLPFILHTHRETNTLLFILYSTYLMIMYYDYFYDRRRGQFGPHFSKRIMNGCHVTVNKISYIPIFVPTKSELFLLDILVFILLAITPMFLREPK